MATQFAKFLESPSSPIPGLYNVLLPLDLRARKILLAICRCQSIPTRGSKIEKHVLRDYPAYRAPTIVTRQDTVLSLSEIVESLSSYITNPILNGFLQMSVKIIKLEDDDVEKAIMETYAKEIVASQERRFTPAIDLHSFLARDRRRRDRPLLRHWTVYSREIHDYIHTQLLSATRSLRERPYYPNYGHKILPKTSYDHFHVLQEILGFSFEGSTIGVESVYSRTGVYSEGPTEMRHAFSYNDLRPRVYYSRGATHYRHSKYIQEVFNRIIEVFPCVHKFERFHISRLEITDGQVFMIYDFSTFTTNLQSLSQFLHGLGDLYSGVEITVIDTFLGPQVIDLGDYIHAYAEECNDHPSYETFYGSSDGEPITYISGAGLLGVPGNISSSTLWHAIILMCLVESLLLKVVGDDAGAALPDQETPSELVAGLKQFGDISQQKSESWTHTDIMTDIESIIWQYVKRQIFRLENRIFCGPSPMIFPNPSLFIQGFADKHHSQPHIEDPVLAAIKCGDRFVRHCAKFSLEEQDEETIEACRKYHNFILRAVWADDKRREELEIPRFVFHRDVLHSDFESWYRHLPGTIVIPEIADSPDLPDEYKIMTHYRIQMRKVWKLVVDLGYGSSKMMTRKVKNTETDMLRKIFEHDYQPLYLAVIFDSCPLWLIDLLNKSLPMPILDDDLYYQQPPEDTLDETVDLDSLFN